MKVINRIIKNPYKVGGRLTSRDLYVERKADIDIEQYIKQSEKASCFILAPRQMGKTSLIEYTIKRLKGEEIIFCPITIQGQLETYDIKAFYRAFFYYLCKSISRYEEWSFDKEVMNMFSSSMPVNTTCKVFLIEKILPRVKHNFIIFIDEIQLLIKYELQTLFLGFIRGLFDLPEENLEVQKALKKIKFVLLGVAKPSDLIEGTELAWNSSKFIELTGFKDEKESEVLKTGLSQISNKPDSLIREILKWTGGQPFLTQRLCYLCFEKGIEGSQINLHKIIDEHIIQRSKHGDNQAHFSQIEKFIRTIEKHGNIDEVVNTLHVYKSILKSEKITFDFSSIEQMNLIVSGLAINENDILKLANKIYAQVFNLELISNKIKILQKRKEENVSQKVERDYVLIIDRSPSMNDKEKDGRSRWDTIEECVCSYLSKEMSEADIDGMVLYFFSGKFRRFDENITPSFVKSRFRELGTGGISTNLAGVLEDALKDYFRRKQENKIKKDGEWILVITDGEPDLKKPVFDLIVEATKKIESRSELAISFLRIGNEQSAIDFLQEIDDDLVKKHGAKQDICDTKSFYNLEDNDLKWLEYEAFND